MLLTYNYKGQNYKVFIHWTADTGSSTVFQEIVQRISDKHQLDPGDYGERSKHLDALTDKLYEQFYIFNNEHSGIPYNPRFRQSVLRAFSEISGTINGYLEPVIPEDENLFAGLFITVADKLREMMDIYLADNAYQCKFRERMRYREAYLETTPQNLASYEFEDILLQMTDLARVLDCLTEIQRRRLVKHIFLKYTLQEIAAQEKVDSSVVHRSVSASLKKLRQQLTE